MLKFLEDEIRWKNPSAEIENIRVSSLKFSACTGCMKCRSCGKCVFAGDDADVAGEKIASADFLVVASPCWWGNMTGSLKSLFDRNPGSAKKMRIDVDFIDCSPVFSIDFGLRL